MKWRSTTKSLLTLVILAGVFSTQKCHAKFVFDHRKRKKVEGQIELSPWFTGPLLSPSGYVIPVGHVNIEPYFYYTVNTGSYSKKWKPVSSSNFYTKSVQIPIQFGVAPALDFDITPQFLWNSYKGSHYFDIGDTMVMTDIQLLNDTPDRLWQPAIKLALSANLPLGKYRHLNPDKQGTDAIGQGSWLPEVLLVFSRIYQLGNSIHFIDARLSFSYTIGTVSYVKGLNTYGGDTHTKGKVYPGNTLVVDGAIEISLSQRWSYAMDIVYGHENKTRFSGRTKSPVGNPSKEQFSLAPAFEYSWNSNVGILSGVWFTFMGRNSTKFTSGVVAINIYI